ncbi:protein serine/threonine phosphatase 2C, partial [Gonapodya prolifera JEL478]
SFFVVSDGHRGNRVSHYLSRRIHWRVASMDEFERKEYGEALRLGFMAVEQELFKAYATVLRGKEPAGSTCCCALVTDDKELFVANVGDSRAVLSCGGVTVPMSFDHKPGLPEERQRISRAGSSVIEGRVQGRLATARAFGDFDFKRNRNLPLEEQAVTAKPEVLRKQLKDDDEFIVIASDGVWDVLTNDSVVTFVRSRIAAGIPLPQISEEMLDYCLAARPSRADVAVSGIGGTDNMTCIMVAFLFGRTWEEYVDQIRARYGQVDSEPVIEIDPSTGLPVSNSPPLKTMRPEDFVAINPRRKTDRIERASTSGNPFCCYAEEDEEDQDSLEPPPALPAGVMHEDDGEISEKAAMDKTPVANGNGNGYHSEFEPVEMFVPPAADSTEKLEPEVVSGKPVAVGPPLSMSSPTATVSA